MSYEKVLDGINLEALVTGDQEELTLTRMNFSKAVQSKREDPCPIADWPIQKCIDFERSLAKSHRMDCFRFYDLADRADKRAAMFEYIEAHHQVNTFSDVLSLFENRAIDPVQVETWVSDEILFDGFLLEPVVAGYPEHAAALREQIREFLAQHQRPIDYVLQAAEVLVKRRKN